MMYHKIGWSDAVPWSHYLTGKISSRVLSGYSVADFLEEMLQVIRRMILALPL